ncbi:MAG TPA: DUF503 domain-containing protein [bacterium]
MMVGTLQVEFFLPDVFSLKEKRFVIQSLKTKIRNRFNVSVAEVDYQDKWQRAVFGVACVSADRQIVESTMDKVLDMCFQEDRIEVLNQSRDIF